MTEPFTPLRRGTAAGRGTLLAAILGSGMVFLDATVVNVALPHIGAEFDAGVADLQWTVDGYLLMLAAFLLLGGALGDRFGRRRVFLLGVLWFTVASLLAALAPTTGFLIAARFLQGAGGALLAPGSLALLQASFHSDDRGRVIGTWSGLAGVSTALGPLVGGWLIDTLSWRYVFLMNLPLAVVVVLAALRWAPESRERAASPHQHQQMSPSGQGRFDLLGALLGALGLTGVTYALIDATHRGPGALPVLAAALVGLAAWVAFWVVERRRGERATLPPALFADRLFAVLNGYTVLVYAALIGQSFFLAVFLQNAAGYSALATGLATVPMTVLLLIGSSRAGALGTRIGPRLPLTVGPLIAAAGLLLLRGITPDGSYWTQVLPGVTLFGVGMTLVVAPLTASVLAAAADRFAGTASGVNNAASRVGGLLAVATLPLLVGLSGGEYDDPAALTAGFRAALLWCVGLMVAAALLAAALVRRPVDRATGSPGRATGSPGRRGRTGGAGTRQG